MMKSRGRLGKILYCGALLSGVSPALSAEPGTCSRGRELVRKDQTDFYKVGDRASTLYMISRDLYGDESHWPQIAKWNGLHAPYRLKKGQLLELRGEPKLDEAEGTRALIAGWERVNKRGKFQATSQSEIGALRACLVTEKAEATPIVVITPVPAPTPVNNAGPVPGPDLRPEHIAEIEAEAYGPFHHAWRVSLAATASIFDLDTVNEELESERKFHSKVNYGAALGIERHLSERWSLGADVGIERVRIKPFDEVVLANAERNFVEFALELGYEVAEPLSLSLKGAYAQRPFAEETLNGVDVHAPSIPEISLGARLRFFESEKAAGWIVGEGTYAFETRSQGLRLAHDFGYLAGLRFDFKLSGSVISLSPSYRMLKVGDGVAESKQNAFLLELAWQL